MVVMGTHTREFGVCLCEQEFPIFRDRMPTQLLAYLRLARLTDPALLAKVHQHATIFVISFAQ